MMGCEARRTSCGFSLDTEGACVLVNAPRYFPLLILLPSGVQAACWQQQQQSLLHGEVKVERLQMNPEVGGSNQVETRSGMPAREPCKGVAIAAI